MKVIKQGERRWWIGRNLECDACDTVFELDADDDITDQLGFMGYGRYITVKCPTCKLTIKEFKVSSGAPDETTDDAEVETADIV